MMDLKRARDRGNRPMENRVGVHSNRPGAVRRAVSSVVVSSRKQPIAAPRLLAAGKPAASVRIRPSRVGAASQSHSI